MKIRSLLALLPATVAFPLTAATIANPSFEDNAASFTVFPGYVSGNTSIQNWAVSNAAQSGINNTATASGTPFTGTNMPHGTAAAFVQSVGGATNTMTGQVSGLTPGKSYTLSFQSNTRSGYATPTGTATVAGSSVSWAATNSSRYVPRQLHFTATTATENIVFSSRTPVGDGTLAIDNVRVAEGRWTTKAWSTDATIPFGAPVTHAYNFNSSASPVVSGVAFTGLTGSNPSAAGTAGNGGFATTGFGNVATDSSVNVTGAGVGLANAFVYGANPGTLTLNNLTPGKNYTLNLMSLAWEDGFRNFTVTHGSDAVTWNQDLFGNNNGAVFSIPYTATGTSETFSFSAEQAGQTFHLYAFYNLAPEPSRALLAALSCAPFVMARRRSGGAK